MTDVPDHMVIDLEDGPSQSVRTARKRGHEEEGEREEQGEK